MSSPLPVPDGTPHFRRNVHAGIVVVVEPVVIVLVVELVVVEVVEVRRGPART